MLGVCAQFTLCITMKVEPGIAKQYKCHHCDSCKNYRERGCRVGEKIVFALFFGCPEDREFVEKMHFEASCSKRQTLTTGLQKCLQSWQ